MDNTTLAVKDLILNEKDLMSLVNKKKKSVRQCDYSYQVVMQSGCDFAVRRNVRGRKKYTLLVILPSQEQYYIEEGNTRKKLTAALLKSFMRGLGRDNTIPLPGVSWLDHLRSEYSFCDALFHYISARSTIVIPYETKLDAIRKGLIYVTYNTYLFDEDFGITGMPL